MEMWPDTSRLAYSVKRKAEVAAGIFVPPNGNRSNKNFRHTDETKILIKEKVLSARSSATRERGSYMTTAGKISFQTKWKQISFEKRKQFSIDTKEAIRLANEKRSNEADVFAKKHFSTILQMQKQGMTLTEIARKMNKDGHKTRRGSVWTIQTVQQIIKRMANKLRLRDRLKSEIVGVAVPQKKRVIGWDRKI